MDPVTLALAKSWAEGQFGDLRQLQQHIAALQAVSGLAQAVDELQVVSALAPYAQAILDSRIVDHNLDVPNPPNGQYVRWENGLQVCWLPRLTLTRYSGSQARAVWTFPAEFVNTNYSVHITQAWTSGDTRADKVTMAFSQNRSTSNCIPTLTSKDRDIADGESWGVHLVAIGRWK